MTDADVCFQETRSVAETAGMRAEAVKVVSSRADGAQIDNSRERTELFEIGRSLIGSAC